MSLNDNNHYKKLLRTIKRNNYKKVERIISKIKICERYDYATQNFTRSKLQDTMCVAIKLDYFYVV